MVKDEGIKFKTTNGAYQTLAIDVQVVSTMHMALLTQNKMRGMLKASWMVENGQGILHYQVTSKLPADEYFSRYTLSPSKLKNLLMGMEATVLEADRHFLMPSCFLMDFNKLYIDPHEHQVYMMYDPSQENYEMEEAISRLYTLLFEIVSHKVRLENGPGMGSLLKLMNQLKGSNEMSHRDALKFWFTEKDLEHETALPQFETTVPVLSAQKSDVETYESMYNENHRNPFVERSMTDFNDFSTSDSYESEQIRPSQEVKLKDAVQLKRAVGKQSLMVFCMGTVAIMAVISFIRSIGFLEIIAAVLFSFLITVLVSHIFLRNTKVNENNLEEVLQPHSFTPLQSVVPLRFEEGSSSHYEQDELRALSKDTVTSNALSPRPVSMSMSHTFMSEPLDNRTVLLDAAVVHPVLKAINVGVADIEIKQDRLLIGRCPTSSDITLSSNTVGRIHAEILYNGLELRVKDFNTLNGTYINGERIHDAYRRIENMDILKLSCFEFRVVLP